MRFVMIGLLLMISPAQAQQLKSNEPYHSCRMLYVAQRKCGFGFDSCDQRIIESLEKQCLLDDGGTIGWPPNAGSSW